MRRSALAATALALLLAAPARADVLDDFPAAASRGAGDAFLFARAADGAVLERHKVTGGWSDWTSLGGEATSGPAAAAYDGTIVVFVRGGDRQVHQNTLLPTGWTGWTSVGGDVMSAPAVTVRRGAGHELDLGARGQDNSIWLKNRAGGKWSGWSSIGGNLTSAPTLNSQGDGILNVMARGVDGSVMQRSWTGTAWFESWGSIGASILGAPASVSRRPGYLNMYARARDQTLLSRSWSASAWGAWGTLDKTPIDSTPAAYSEGPDHEALVARKGANLLLKEWNAGKGWGAWTDLGPIAVPAPPPPAPPAPAPPAPAESELDLEAGVRCTPPGGRVRVSITVRRRPGKPKPRVNRIVFFTRGKQRAIRVDRKAPFVVRMPVNRPAGKAGRVYARIYYKRSARGKLVHKTVSRRYVVCR